MKTYKNSIKCAVISGLISTLFGCSQQFTYLNESSFLSLLGKKNVVLSPEHINALPYASIYAQVAGHNQVFMVLGYSSLSLSASPDSSAGHFTLKWLSADNKMLVTEHGRLIKTVNLHGQNLTASYSHQRDPLALGLLKSTTPHTWTRKVDWQPGYHVGYTLTSRFERQEESQLVINQKPISSVRFIEYVTNKELNVDFENQYWLDPYSGRVLASSQTPAPGMPQIKITVLKPFSEEYK